MVLGVPGSIRLVMQNLHPKECSSNSCSALEVTWLLEKRHGHGQLKKE